MAWYKDSNINNGTFVRVEDTNNAKFGKTRNQELLTISLANNYPTPTTTLTLNIDGEFTVPTPGYGIKALIGGVNPETVTYSNYNSGTKTLTLSSPTTLAHIIGDSCYEQNSYLNVASGGALLYYNDFITGLTGKVYSECKADFTILTELYGLVLRHSADINGTDCYFCIVYQFSPTQKSVTISKIINNVFTNIITSNSVPSGQGLQNLRFRVDNSAMPVLAIDIDGIEIVSTIDSSGTKIITDGQSGIISYYAVSTFNERFATGTWV